MGESIKRSVLFKWMGTIQSLKLWIEQMGEGWKNSLFLNWGIYLSCLETWTNLVLRPSHSVLHFNYQHTLSLSSSYTTGFKKTNHGLLISIILWMNPTVNHQTYMYRHMYIEYNPKMIVWTQIFIYEYMKFMSLYLYININHMNLWNYGYD